MREARRIFFLVGLAGTRLRKKKLYLQNLMRISSAIAILFISILILVGNIYGIDKTSNREEKINFQSVINISSIQIVADLNSLKNCLVGIKYYPGNSFEYVRNHPSGFSGILYNGVHFQCVDKVPDGKKIFVRDLTTVN
jgi:hypothetical protein